jgi:hypothetical protein
MNYDIIGDIHGYADALEALIRHMGYRQTCGTWRHGRTGSANGGSRLGSGCHGQSRIQCRYLVY